MSRNQTDLAIAVSQWKTDSLPYRVDYVRASISIEAGPQTNFWSLVSIDDGTENYGYWVSPGGQAIAQNTLYATPSTEVKP